MPAPLYESMVGGVIIFPGFMRTSIDRDLVIPGSLPLKTVCCLRYRFILAVVRQQFMSIPDYAEESEILIVARRDSWLFNPTTAKL
jgi:hypothetical protein